MDIHQQIKAARERLGWSQGRLAKEVSREEGLATDLHWQTVQQWENGKSAPKRTRMAIVRRLLQITDDDENVVAEEAPQQRTPEADAIAAALDRMPPGADRDHLIRMFRSLIEVELARMQPHQPADQPAGNVRSISNGQ